MGRRVCLGPGPPSGGQTPGGDLVMMMMMRKEDDDDVEEEDGDGDHLSIALNLFSMLYHLVEIL